MPDVFMGTAKAGRGEAVTVCRVDDIPADRGKVVTVRGKSIGLFRVDGTVHALANRCPHKGAPLALGRVRPMVCGQGPECVEFERDGTIVKCPWHLWEFEIESGRAVCDPRLRVRTYHTETVDGWVRIYLR